MITAKIKSKIILIAVIMAVVATSFFLVVNITPLSIAAYVFTVLAIALFCSGNLFLINNTKSYPWVAILPMTIWRYLTMQAVLSLIFVFLENTQIFLLPAKWFILLHIIILGYFLTLLTTLKGGQEIIENFTETREAEIKTNIAAFRSMQYDIKSLMNKFPAYAKDLRQVADAIRYSDPMSHPSLDACEEGIQLGILAIKDITESDIEHIPVKCASLLQQIADRNGGVKNLK